VVRPAGGAGRVSMAVTGTDSIPDGAVQSVVFSHSYPTVS
jgi:hypothetical protein